MNTFYLDYFRRLRALPTAAFNQCFNSGAGSVSNRYHYLVAKQSGASSADPDCFARILDISSAWLRDVPVLFSKEDFDFYVRELALFTSTPIIAESGAATVTVLSETLSDALEQYQNGKRGKSPTEQLELALHAALPVPNYSPSPLRFVMAYADQNFISVQDFAKHFVTTENGFSAAQVEPVTARLLMARTLPVADLPKSFLAKFATWSGVPLAQVSCDFVVRSDAAAFNLFLAADMFVSPWSVSRDGDGGSTVSFLSPRLFL